MPIVSSSCATLDPAEPKRMSAAAALWLQALIVVTFFAASSAPSPLYAVYREAWGFSALTLTLVFSSYAIALLAALLVFGALSDHRGRREVVIGALVLEIGAMLLFWRAESVGWLFGARVLQGIATGIATSALSAGLLDLHRERGALINSVGPLVGMALGALGTSLLAQFAPAPTRLVFDLLLLALALQTIAAFFLPETVSLRPGAWKSLRPRMALPPAARRVMARVLPVNTAQWALGGFYLSLGPTLARHVTGDASPVTGGALIAALVLSGAGSIVVVRERDPRLALRLGAALLAGGLAITLAGIEASSGTLLFAGAVVAGLGFGAAFNGSVRSLVPLAAPHERAGLMASFYVLSYLAFSLPAIAAGFAVGHFGLQATSTAYGLVLVAMALAALHGLGWFGTHKPAVA